jgi:hypothetical protein
MVALRSAKGNAFLVVEIPFAEQGRRTLEIMGLANWAEYDSYPVFVHPIPGFAPVPVSWFG